MNLSPYIDHTLLKPTILKSEVEQLCREALEYGFAAVCIPPPFVRLAVRLLKGSPVKVCTVIGFPFGYSVTRAKGEEIRAAIQGGAEELDMVINLSDLKNGNWPCMETEIQTLLPLVREAGKVIKVIVESGLLTEGELVRCCKLYGDTGVDYLKTSTGYAGKGATVEAVEIMRKQLNSQVKIKASGGIRTAEFARELIEAGASRIGTSSGVSICR